MNKQLQQKKSLEKIGKIVYWLPIIGFAMNILVACIVHSELSLRFGAIAGWSMAILVYVVYRRHGEQEAKFLRGIIKTQDEMLERYSRQQKNK